MSEQKPERLREDRMQLLRTELTNRLLKLKEQR